MVNLFVFESTGREKNKRIDETFRVEAFTACLLSQTVRKFCGRVKAKQCIRA